MEYGDLTEVDREVLESDREFFPAVVEAHHPGESIAANAGDLPLMQLVLRGGAYTEDATAELIALGTCFGDLLAHEFGLHWTRYADAEGVDLALRYRDTSVIVFPRSMILKRVERGEELPDLADLFDQVGQEVARQAEGQAK